MKRALALLALASCTPQPAEEALPPEPAPQWCANEVASLGFQNDAMYHQWLNLSDTLVKIERIAEERGYDDIKEVVAEATTQK